MNIGVAAIVLILTLAGSGSARVVTGADASSEVVAQLGRESYLQYCASCHGLDARGDGPVGASLKQAPPDLTAVAERRQGSFSDREIASLIDGRSMPMAHGTREMPVWGRRFSAQLGGGEVGEESVRGYLLLLVEYLRSIQRSPEPK
jgi:mono/diheme cytochrome c family protein